jgi:hypothetical protein
VSTGLLTIVDDYIAAAIRHARVWVDEEGFVVAHLEGHPGVRAHGDDVRACRVALSRETDQWIRTWLANGYDLPIFDGIDLNGADADVLARYRRYTEGHDPALDDVLSEEEFLAELGAA